MSQPASAPPPGLTERTFSSYNKEQGQAYAEARRDYDPSLYHTVMSHHTSTGGQLDTLLDVGCGPGTAVRRLAPYFNHAIGIDPSEGMLTTACLFGGVTSTSEPVRFEVSTAEQVGENISPPIQDSSVDLITAATAAHWFDMSRFWPSAARVLKPGGSVALWTSSEIHIHPSVPNAAAIQAAIDRTRDLHLTPYYVPGNLLTRDLYVTLPLPWTTEAAVPEFDESTFFRKVWGGGEERFYTGEPEVDLNVFEKILGTASPVTRWRQAHPNAVGTEHDVIRMLRREIEQILHEAGVEKGKETMRGTVQGALLMVKKKM